MRIARSGQNEKGLIKTERQNKFFRRKAGFMKRKEAILQELGVESVESKSRNINLIGLIIYE